MRLDQINPSGCDTTILLQEVLNLFVQKHNQQNSGLYTAHTMTVPSGHTYHVFCSAEILLQKQQASNEGMHVCYDVSGHVHMVVQG